MFEQSFVHATASTNRGAPVVLSLLLQMSVIGTAVLIPLMNPDLLPSGMMGNTLFLAPPAPPPAPPPKTQLAATVTRVAQNVWKGALTIPALIPNKVVMIEDPPDTNNAMSVIGGLPDGPSGSAENGVLRRLLNSMPHATPPPPAPAAAVKDAERAKPILRHRIGGNVQEAMLVSRKMPDYPAMARAMRVEGKVVFQAVIGTAGTIQQLQLVSGHPLLVQAAMDAVRQWRYRPTMLNGDPVEVDTTISVTFTLNR